MRTHVYYRRNHYDNGYKQIGKRPANGKSWQLGYGYFSFGFSHIYRSDDLSKYK
jgi:hypothetical protein